MPKVVSQMTKGLATDNIFSRYRISAPCTLQCLYLPIYDTKSHAFLWPDVLLQTHRFMEEQDADPTENPPMPCTKRNKAPKVGPADIPNEQVTVNWRIRSLSKILFEDHRNALQRQDIPYVQMDSKSSRSGKKYRHLFSNWTWKWIRVEEK